MKDEFEILDDPTPEDRAAILDELVAFNERHGPPSGFRFLAIVIRDDQGKIVGGLWGRTAFDWLFIEMLVLPETMRGQGRGRTLIAKAEVIARERGCIGIWLDTYDFQARPFYEKLGFTLFGRLDDHPKDGTRYFLQKRF